MKKILFFLCTLGCLWLVTTCEKNDTKSKQSGYLIFGRFNGTCSTDNCVDLFKIENGHLWEDQNGLYQNAGNFYHGTFSTLPRTKYDKVQSLKAFFPAELLSEDEVFIGQPEALQEGGLYIEYFQGGTRKFWIVDNSKGNVPSYLHSFIDMVNQSIDEINKKPVFSSL